MFLSPSRLHYANKALFTQNQQNYPYQYPYRYGYAGLNFFRPQQSISRFKTRSKYIFFQLTLKFKDSFFSVYQNKFIYCAKALNCFIHLLRCFIFERKKPDFIKNNIKI